MNLKPIYHPVLPLTLFVFVTACQEPATPQGQTVVVPTTEQPTIDTLSSSVTAIDPIAHLRKTPQTLVVNPARDTIIQFGESGSCIHIPKNAFVDDQGKVVVTPVELKVTDYRNSAEIALSGIPMTYSAGFDELVFNSAGMFDLQGTSAGKSIEVASDKSLSVDYALVQKPDNLGYFLLGEDGKTWEKLKNLKVPKETTEQKNPKAKEIATPVVVLEIENKKPDNEKKKRSSGLRAYTFFPYVTPITYCWSDDQKKLVSLEALFLKRYSVPKAMSTYLKEHLDHYISIQYDVDDLTRKLVNVRPHKYNPVKDYDESLVQFLKDLEPFTKMQVNYELGVSDVKTPYELHIRYEDAEALAKRNDQVAFVNDQNAFNAIQFQGTNQGFISPTSSDAGHTYPDVVKGLTVKRFGIYNCDQAMRMQGKVDITASLMDEHKNIIEDAWVLSVIDIDFVGAFSFSPERFSFSSQNETALLLTTKAGRIFMLGQKQLEKMKITQSGKYDFIMTDVTNEIKTSEDLAKKIGLKS